MESGIQLKQFRMLLMIGIHNPSSCTDKESGLHNGECVIPENIHTSTKGWTMELSEGEGGGVKGQNFLRVGHVHVK